MGAWDATSFGNDTANDWAYDLEESDDLSYIEAALKKVLKNGGYVEAPDAEEAIAAAEVLAWLQGHRSPLNAYTEKIAAWVDAHPLQPSPDLIEQALTTLDKLEGESSELAELWEGDESWTAAISDLRTRLEN